MAKNPNLIYVIGDSHVNFFSGNSIMQPIWPEHHVDRVPIFRTYRLGAPLAYNLVKPSSDSRRKLFSVLKKIPSGSNLILSYGEIDCRVHLVPQAEKQGKSLEAVVNECVDRYFEVVKEVHKMGHKIIIFHLVPSTAFNIPYQEFPTCGTPLERNEATVLFNKRLSYLAKKNKFPQISLFNKLVKPTGLTDMRYYADPIHLSLQALPMVIKEIDKKVPGVNKELLHEPYKINHVEYLYYSVFRKFINFWYIRFRNLEYKM